MANGVIIPSDNGGWITINANLDYMVRNGIVFLNIKATVTGDSWQNVGTLPAAIAPEAYIYQSILYNPRTAIWGNVYVGGTSVQSQGSSSLSTIISYPLKK